MTKILHYLRWRALTGIVILTFGLLSCSDPLTPVKPEWDTNLNVPLIAQTYTLEELLAQDSTLEIEPGADNILILRKSFPLESIPLGDRITLDDNYYHYGQQLGALDYDIPDLLDRDVLVRDVFPSMKIQTAPVAPISNSSALDVYIDARQYFKEMTFKKGRITFTIENTLPVPVEFPSPAIVNDANGNSLGTLPVNGQIAPGATKILPPFPLDGKTITDDMLLKLFVATPGSNGATVTVKSSQGLHITAKIEQTEILSAVAFLPSQDITYDELVDITGNDGSTVQSGKLRAGILNVRLQNHIPVGANMTLTVNALKDASGNTLIRNVHVTPAHGTNIWVSVAGYTFTPVNGKFISYSLNIVTDPAESQPVLIKAVDSVSITAELTDVVFDDVQGTLATRTIAVDQEQDVNFDFSSRLQGDIVFSKAKMWAVLTNHAQVPVETDHCRVTGILTGTSKTASVSVPNQRINGGTETTVNFNDSEVLNFLNTFTQEFPNRLRVQGDILLNPDGTQGSASSNDEVSGTLWVELPLEFSMKSGAINDTTAFTMSKENQQRFDEVNAGTITFDMENHLPADMVLETTIMDQDYNVLIEPRQVDGSEIKVASAELDGSGYVQKATVSKSTIAFDREEFKKLVLSKWIKVRLRMNTEQARNVAFRSTDYIKIRAYATLNVKSTILE